MIKMVNKVLNIGDKIELFKAEDKEEASRKQYLSQLLDFVEEDKVRIAMPIEGGHVIPLTIGDRYELCFYSATGLYQCKAEIMDRYKENNVYLMVVQFLSDLEKCQRRQFYRLEHIMDIQYRLFTTEEERLINRLKMDEFANEEAKINCKKILDGMQKKWITATITDISGGGIRFNSNLQYQKDHQIYMKIPFEMNGTTREYELKGNIVSSEVLLHKKGYFETRVEFIEIDHEQRETIVKFVFEQERRMLRRGIVG